MPNNSEDYTYLWANSDPNLSISALESRKSFHLPLG